jgi:glutathione S-transferase
MTTETRLRLYDYGASGNCYKVRLLLAQLERPYERIPIDIFAGETLTDEYGRINPFRSTPVLEIAPGRYLLESNAILLYLAHRTPLLPTGATDQSEVVRWLIHEQTDLIPAIAGLRFRLQTGRIAPDGADAIRRRNAGEELLGFLNDHLSGREFLVADRYTIADIAGYGYTHVAHEAGYDLDRWPAVGGWLARIAEQPGYVNDLLPYPPNAQAGAGRSVYDP